MPERVRRDAVLYTLPFEWGGVVRDAFEQAGPKTIEAQSYEEMMSLLESHTFQGVLTISSWVSQSLKLVDDPEFLSLIRDTPLMIIVDTQKRFDITGKRSSWEWCTLPFDLEELIGRSRRIGLIP